MAKICKSIKELEIKIDGNNHGIAKLIEAQEELFNVRLHNQHSNDEIINEVIENSLIKHANTIQYFKIGRQPITNILSSLVNLKRLELDCDRVYCEWNCLKNLSLPFLQILRTKCVPIKALSSLIENTSGSVVDQTQLCSEFDLGHHQIGSLISNIPNRNFRFGISMSEM